MQWVPNGWRPKAVAVDIDGTITDYNKKLHLGAIQALRRLEDAVSYTHLRAHET